MQLIGMLDSPYVRRVAVSLQALGLPFEHRPLSVFRHVDEFRRINPVVKAPTLVCDDGTMLTDSTLILDYAEALAAPRSLMPRTLPERRQALHRLGLALAACEKAVQLVYERAIRPEEKRHQPWVDRVTMQLQGGLAALEAAHAGQPVDWQQPTQDAITSAVVWHFLMATLGGVDPAPYPTLAALSAQAEQQPSFQRAPHGDGVVAAP